MQSLIKTLSILTALSFATVAQAQSQAITKALEVYTYDSFTADWGAGPKLKTAFEEQYPQCKINYVAFDSSGTMFNRLRLEGKKTAADVVIGLDNSLQKEAEKTGLFKENQVDLASLDLPIKWLNRTFLPYDFGEYAFIYDKNQLTNPPKSLKELVERQDLRIIYQDPRTSGVGRGLIAWFNHVYPSTEIEQAWQTLAKHTVTVGKGWSESYGAFLKGESDLVLSYSTSPLYHFLYEQKEQYAATNFSEGSVVQIELAAKIAKNEMQENSCAEPFLSFLITPKAQEIIAKNNVMLPVISTPIEPHFDQIKQQLKQKHIFNSEPSESEITKQWIQTWQRNLSK